MWHLMESIKVFNRISLQGAICKLGQPQEHLNSL
jgi:hypothetical protein